MKSIIPMEKRILVPVHFNATLATRTRIERYAEERGISMRAALREIVNQTLDRTGAVEC